MEKHPSRSYAQTERLRQWRHSVSERAYLALYKVRDTSFYLHGDDKWSCVIHSAITSDPDDPYPYLKACVRQWRVVSNQIGVLRWDESLVIAASLLNPACSLIFVS